MKVVGGPHDGMDVHDPGIDITKLINPVGERAIEWLCSECGRVAPEMTSYTIYTVRRFYEKNKNGNLDILEFLAPHDWSDMQAMRHQFRK